MPRVWDAEYVVMRWCCDGVMQYPVPWATPLYYGMYAYTNNTPTVHYYAPNMLLTGLDGRDRGIACWDAVHSM